MNKNCILLILIFYLFSWQSVIAQERWSGPRLAPESEEKFKLGMAGYTFLKFDIDQTLVCMERVNIHYLCIKDFHLPIKSTDEQILFFLAKLKSKGVTGYAVGPIYMKSEVEIDRAFEYANRVGVKLIIGIPAYKLLPYIEKKVREYDFRYAIHLHGPDIDVFPDADDVWNHIQNLDPRIGMCLDIGHDTRNGKNAVEDLRKYHSRIFDIHLKDVTAANKLGYSLEVGRGIINIPSFVRMLRKVNYSDVCSLEHEKDMSDPFLGIAESIGYFRGVIEATK